jgi:hypothetical protein
MSLVIWVVHVALGIGEIYILETIREAIHRQTCAGTSGKQGISPGSLGPSVPVAQPGLTNRD